MLATSGGQVVLCWLVPLDSALMITIFLCWPLSSVPAPAPPRLISRLTRLSKEEVRLELCWMEQDLLHRRWFFCLLVITAVTWCPLVLWLWLLLCFSTTGKLCSRVTLEWFKHLSWMAQVATLLALWQSSPLPKTVSSLLFGSTCGEVDSFVEVVILSSLMKSPRVALVKLLLFVVHLNTMLRGVPTRETDWCLNEPPKIGELGSALSERCLWYCWALEVELARFGPE